MLKGFRQLYLNREVLGPFAAIYGVGFAPLLILPFLFTAIISYFSISEAQAGVLVSTELGAMCLGSLLIATVVDRFPKKYVAVFGTALAVIGNLLFMSSTTLMTSYAYLVIAGLGYGIALAAGNAAVAALGARSSDIFNKVVLLGTFMMILLLNIFPRIIVAWSLPGALIGLAVLHCLLIPLLLAIPTSTHAEAAQSSHDSKYAILFKPLSIAIILMMFCYFVRDTMVWVFAENIANTRLGIAPENIGFLFSIHGATSLLGPLLLIWMMRRISQQKLLLMGIIVTGIISMVVSQTQSVFWFSSMVILWSTAHFFTYSCVMGFAAAADPKGVVAAVAGAAVMGGTAVAPAIAGYAMDSGGLTAFTVGVATAVLATFIFSCLSIYLRGKPKGLERQAKKLLQVSEPSKLQIKEI
ncbi:MFS transporter [Psychrobacter urativorans]|uniref:MFS transporter n=1 Tax=Psychrobacter urativorans TaxID=45610 RepID=UPI001917D627|nr:MFS transporter [Psychrobacter urativorans]